MEGEQKRVCLLFRFLLTGVFLILGGWGFHLVATLPYFEIAEVIVEGNWKLQAQEVAADLGLQPGAGILTVDLGALTHNLLRNPWIKEAALRRRLPRSLTVRIVERAPEVVLIGDKAYLLSNDGVVLSELEPGDRGEGTGFTSSTPALSTLHTLPVLRVPADGHYRRGEMVLRPEIIRDLSVLRNFQLHYALPGEGAREIILVEDGSYTVNLGLKMPFIRLKAEDMEVQLNRLKRVLTFTGEDLSRYESVDLRFGQKVIVKPKGGPGGQGV